MAIKSGELIHVGNQVLVDRAQTAGPGTLNVPTEKIYELGNYESVATIRDIADLTFTLESLDVSAEIESMLLGLDFTTMADGTALPLANVLPLDVVSQFKAGRTAANPFDVNASVAMPYLSTESISYRFGLRDNASQTVTLRGDSVFFASASAFIEEVAGKNTADQDVPLPNPAIPYNGDTVTKTRYALGVSLRSGRRLTYGSDYHETVTGTAVDGTRTVTVVVHEPVATNDRVRVTYQSSTAAAYPAKNANGTPTLTHAIASATRPAAIKGRDIEIRVGGQAITDRWSSVQAVTFEQRLTLEKDEELGNSQAVAQDFDVPVVSGTVDLKPRDTGELMQRIRQIAGVSSATEAVGPYQTAVLPLEVLLHSPDDGTVLKTLYTPDARFTLPAFSGRVQQKMTITLNWESDSGVAIAYKGEKPAA